MNRLLIRKAPDAGERLRAPEEEIAERYHLCNEHELAQSPGDGEGKGSLARFLVYGVSKSRTGLGDGTATTNTTCKEIRIKTDFRNFRDFILRATFGGIRQDLVVCLEDHSLSSIYLL